MKDHVPYDNAVVSVQARDGRWFALEVRRDFLLPEVKEALDMLADHNLTSCDDLYGVGDSSVQAHLALISRRPIISTGRKRRAA